MHQSQRLRNFDPALLDPAGNLRPVLPEIEPVYVSGPHFMAELPAKISDQMKANDKVNPCCRNMLTMRATLYKSPSAGDGPDMMIAVCGSCNRKHYRIAVNPIGNLEQRSIKVGGESG